MADIENLDIRLAGKRSDDSVKPCPFCGSENIAYGKYEHACGTRYAILCMNCMAQIDPGWAQSWGAVQGMWNRRAQPANEPLTRCGECANYQTQNCAAKHEQALMDFCSHGIRKPGGEQDA